MKIMKNIKMHLIRKNKKLKMKMKDKSKKHKKKSSKSKKNSFKRERLVNQNQKCLEHRSYKRSQDND